MFPFKSLTTCTSAVTVQKSTPPAQDGLFKGYNGYHSDDSVGKDETELELEKRVFGDDVGFLKCLNSYKTKNAAWSPESEDEVLLDTEEDIAEVDDADLFFLDSERSATRYRDSTPPRSSAAGKDLRHWTGEIAWVDSDDERTIVSLASNPRLRKLRLTEDEDLVNGIEYAKRLRQQFERLYPVPEWANPPPRQKAYHKKRRGAIDGSITSNADGSGSELSVDSENLSAPPLSKLLQDAGSLLRASSTSSNTCRKLRPEIIDIQRSKDVGSTQSSAVTSLEFHPFHTLLLSSGPASTLYLHHVSPHPPHPNPLLTSLHIRHTPISMSTFAPNKGSQIYFSGRRRYFHIWNLSSGDIEKVSRILGHADQQRCMERFKLSPCGKWIGLVGSSRKGGGVITILNAKTNHWIAEARVEGKGGVADFAWWSNGEGLTILGKGGEAIEWSGREKRVIARWIDEGAIGTTVIALGGHLPGPENLGGDRWIAVGSSSGIVNIYDRRTWEKGILDRPKPVRVFDQLVTPISHLEFSRDGQVLCMASRWKRDALRLVHLPSCTVYRNWPTSGMPLGRISALAWSPGGEYLAVGNEQGKIRLWEIRG